MGSKNLKTWIMEDLDYYIMMLQHMKLDMEKNFGTEEEKTTALAWALISFTKNSADNEHYGLKEGMNCLERRYMEAAKILKGLINNRKAVEEEL